MIGHKLNLILFYVKVGDSDSGAYSCHPSNTKPTSTIVYVISGNKVKKLTNFIFYFWNFNQL